MTCEDFCCVNRIIIEKGIRTWNVWELRERRTRSTTNLKGCIRISIFLYKEGGKISIHTLHDEHSVILEALSIVHMYILDITARYHSYWIG